MPNRASGNRRRIAYRHALDFRFQQVCEGRDGGIRRRSNQRERIPREILARGRNNQLFCLRVVHEFLARGNKHVHRRALRHLLQQCAGRREIERHLD